MSHSFVLRQDGLIVAEVHGNNREACFREIMHYAVVYSQDGEKCTIEGVEQADWDAFLADVVIEPDEARH